MEDKYRYVQSKTWRYTDGNGNILPGFPSDYLNGAKRVLPHFSNSDGPIQLCNQSSIFWHEL